LRCISFRPLNCSRVNGGKVFRGGGGPEVGDYNALGFQLLAPARSLEGLDLD